MNAKKISATVVLAAVITALAFVSAAGPGTRGTESAGRAEARRAHPGPKITAKRGRGSHTGKREKICPAGFAMSAPDDN